MGLRGALRRVPAGARPWVIGVVVLGGTALAYAAVAAVLVLLLDASWWEGLPQFLGSALGVGLVTWWRDRGHPVPARSQVRALRSGQLPADADPEEWRCALRRETQVQVWVGRVLVVVLPVALVLLVWVAVSTGSDWVTWAVLLALVVLSAVLWVVRRRNLRRIDVLVRQLPPTSATTAAPRP